tara:strand:+ start:54 stop:1139 length:1086 start_codon:yes stop_codon:yes gene_type:complete
MVQTLRYLNKDLYGWNISLTWLGLLNWIPFFYLFITTKNFLQTTSQRLKVSILLFSGSIPVLITGLGQYFLNWEGPLIFGNGLIIWYIKEISPWGGLSGLFSNQNYAGTWLSVIWPFSLSFIVLNRSNQYKKLFSILLLSITTLTIILTTSRNALSGVLISIPIILGFKSLFIISSIFIFFMFLFFLGKYIPLASSLLDFILSFFPIQFIDKFNKVSLSNILEFRRVNLWNDSINLIASRPIFGLGAAFFPILYSIYYSPINYVEQHTHNLFLELSAGYGFVVSVTFLIFLLTLFFYGWKFLKKGNKSKDAYVIDKSWFAASVIIVLSQMNDVTYYDGRISIIFWVLMSGLRNIILFNIKN